MADQYEELNKIVQAQFMSENPNLIKCSCGNLMEIVQGKVNMDQKDDNN
jgi:hypothetical protein